MGSTFVPFVARGRLLPTSFTLFEGAKEEAAALVLVTAAAMGLAVFDKYVFCWLSGAFGVYESFHVLQIYYDNLPARVDFEWGMPIMFFGTLATLLAAAGFPPKLEVNRSAKIGITLTAVISVYQVVMLFFPYLRLWPLLLTGRI